MTLARPFVADKENATAGVMSRGKVKGRGKDEEGRPALGLRSGNATPSSSVSRHAQRTNVNLGGISSLGVGREAASGTKFMAASFGSPHPEDPTVEFKEKMASPTSSSTLRAKKAEYDHILAWDPNDTRPGTKEKEKEKEAHISAGTPTTSKGSSVTPATPTATAPGLRGFAPQQSSTRRVTKVPVRLGGPQRVARGGSEPPSQKEGIAASAATPRAVGQSQRGRERSEDSKGEGLRAGYPEKVPERKSSPSRERPRQRSGLGLGSAVPVFDDCTELSLSDDIDGTATERDRTSHAHQQFLPPEDAMPPPAAYEGLGSRGTSVNSAGTAADKVPSMPTAAAVASAATVAAPAARRPPVEGFAELLQPDNNMEVNGLPFLKLSCIGKGGSSKVYKVLSKDRKVLALKRVTVEDSDASQLQSYANEIELLKKLRGHAAIIELHEAEVNASEGVIQMVMEMGEVDLHHLLAVNKEGKGCSANFMRLFWQQMLEAVNAVHNQRVVHGDLKPANFVLVKGVLKLIDFGIAKAINTDTINIERESQVGTLNYMCPEAVLDTGKGEIDPETGERKQVMKLGRPSDVWSLGCILYQMAYGHTPFSHLRMVAKLQAIINPDHQIDFGESPGNPELVETVKGCLIRDKNQRLTIPALLKHPFLNPHATVAPVAPSPPPPQPQRAEPVVSRQAVRAKPSLVS
ncbi:unnamed protein product [Chrysoparadoxa australica]